MENRTDPPDGAGFYGGGLRDEIATILGVYKESMEPAVLLDSLFSILHDQHRSSSEINALLSCLRGHISNVRLPSCWLTTAELCNLCRCSRGAITAYSLTLDGTTVESANADCKDLQCVI